MSLSRIVKRRMRGGVSILLGISLLFVMLPFHTFASEEFNYKVSAVYRVQSDTTTRVEETYSVSNNVDNKYLDGIQLSTPIDDAKNIAVEYSDGTSIPFTTELKKSENQGYSYNYLQINIKFSRPNTGKGLNWQFIVSYNTNKLVETKGSAHTVSIPAVPQEGNSEYSVMLYVPESFGTLHTTGVKPTSLGVKRGEAVYSFGNKSLLKKSALMVFGDSTIYEVNFNFPLQNDSSFSSTYTVTLPPNTSGQQIVVQKLDPQPKSTRLDGDGNILADYDVPAHTKINVSTNIIGLVSYIDYNLAASGTKSDIPKNLVSAYTSPQPYWPADNPTIVAKANELTKDKKTVAEQVRAINDYVVSNLSYNNEKIKYNIRQGGLKALQNPTNVVCLEYSDSTISLLRAAGIPARMPIGYGYSGSLKQSNSVSDSLHSWVQAYVPNIGWMNLDPTWNEKFENFGSSDLDHLAFAIWGIKDNSPAPVMQNGNDTNYQYENTTITYKSTPPVFQTNSKMSAQKWLVLPFIALARFQVQSPSDTAGDNYEINTRQGTKLDNIVLGSLAPSQKTTKWLLVFGSYAWGSLSADFTQSGNASVILASTKISPQSWPMWAVLLLVTSIILIKLIQSHVQKRNKLNRINSKPIPTIDSVNSKKSNKNVKE